MSSHGWFRRPGLRRARPAINNRRPFGASLEQLEDRCVPSVAATLQPVAISANPPVLAGAQSGTNAVHQLSEAPALTYSGHKIHIITAARHTRLLQTAPTGFDLVDEGGPVLANVEVETVYVGDYWNTTAGQPLAKKIDGFFGYVTSSPYMGILSQYGVNPGTFTGETFIPTSFAAGTSLDDSDIQTVLQQAISTGSLAAPNANTLYAVLTPPNVAVTLDGDSSTNGLLGYHSSFTITDSTGVDTTGSYAVIAHPTGNTPITGLSLFANITAVASHELAESATDPQPLDNTTWVDPLTGDEVADPGEGQFGVLKNYTVQALWSNAANALVLPTGVQQNGITVSVGALQATADTDFSASVATFQDPTGTGDPTAYQAVIDWGDGTTSLGSITLTATPTAKGASHARKPTGRRDNTFLFTVTGDHIYDTAGKYTVSVQITRSDGMMASGKGTAKVAGDTTNSTDLVGSGQDVSATPGDSFTATVASFTDLGVLLGSQDGQVSNYSATIDWGDGSTSTAVIEAADSVAVGLTTVTLSPLQGASRVIIRDGLPQPLSGDYIVQGTHTYASAGSFDISVTINRNDGATTSTNSTATVQTAPTTTLTATGQDITEEVGVTFTDTVATFVDLPDPIGLGLLPIATDSVTHTYKATIDWGDGSTSAGTILPGLLAWGFDTGVGIGQPSDPGTSPQPGDYLVQGTHSYARADSFTVTVTITRDDGVTATATSTATVVPAPTPSLNATGVDVSADAGVSFTDTVATFSETPTGDQPGTSSSFTATIDWGDGTTSTGTIVPAPLLYGFQGGLGVTLPPVPSPSIAGADTGPSINPLPNQEYLVQGTHTYASTGSFTVIVTITGDSGDTATATSTATVVTAPVSGSLTINAEPVAGTAETDVAAEVATFTDNSSGGTGAGTPNGCPMFTSYTATIDWGDGTTSAGLVVPTFCADPVTDPTGTGGIGGTLPTSVTYFVFADHTYFEAGSFTITVMISGADGETGSGTNTAMISAALAV